MKTRLVFYDDGSVALFERKEEGLELIKHFCGQKAHENAVDKMLKLGEGKASKMKGGAKYTDHAVREKAKELRQANDKVKNLESKLAELKKSHDELKKDHDDLESMLKDANLRRQDLYEETESLKKAGKGMEDLYNKMREDRDHWKKAYELAKKKVDSGEESALEELLAEAQSQIEAEREACNKKVKELEAKLASNKQPEEIPMTNTIVLALLRELRECAIDMREKIQDAHEKILNKKRRKF